MRPGSTTPIIITLLAGMSLAVLACCCGGGGGGARPPAAQPAQADPGEIADTTGRLLAERALERVLVAPATAEYPDDTITAQELPAIEGKRAWFVTGAVDSENRLGAKIRGNWEVVFVLNDDSYVPLFISLDGETVFGDPDYRP